ncbi:hypothetical protein BDQ12DRAFT_646188 [Crucibulum laeve]|uniref:Uncharacterized protein n=1 Tax=Crucibulum laeve TaxID=68775 RepID=A0A5C3M8B8_9AGAR|nr:hypothetical protein BDQ12DRAFT_646188 [Crucibulum laeve]
MSTLITGGTGQTGLKLAHLLHEANQPFLITSRSGAAPKPYKSVRFDWLDSATFENPFLADPTINRVYLIGPPVDDMVTQIKPFIDLAVTKGVKRFVLLSASQLDKGDPAMGKVHEYLVDIGVEYSILRPTWFADNFTRIFITSIRNEDHIFSVAKDGRIPFVSTQDIAQAAFDALLAEKAPNNEPYVLGPVLYSYEEAAELLTEILGRKIFYKRRTEAEHRQFFESFGLPKGYAELLVSMELKVGDGSEEAFFNIEARKKIIGKESLRDYLLASKEAFSS